MNVFASYNILYIITDDSFTPHWLRSPYRLMSPTVSCGQSLWSILKALRMSGNVMIRKN